MKRNATAVWNGTGKEGKGHLTTHSKTLDKIPFTYMSRFESAIGTHPEELIAAAHAGCFTMKVSFLLNAAGFTADEIETDCAVTLEKGEITSSHLSLKAKVPGVDKEKFDAIVLDARENCIISKVLKVNITHDAVLNN